MSYVLPSYRKDYLNIYFIITDLIQVLNSISLFHRFKLKKIGNFGLVEVILHRIDVFILVQNHHTSLKTEGWICIFYTRNPKSSLFKFLSIQCQVPSVSCLKVNGVQSQITFTVHKQSSPFTIQSFHLIFNLRTL